MKCGLEKPLLRLRFSWHGCVPFPRIASPLLIGTRGSHDLCYRCDLAGYTGLALKVGVHACNKGNWNLGGLRAAHREWPIGNSQRSTDRSRQSDPVSGP